MKDDRGKEGRQAAIDRLKAKIPAYSDTEGREKSNSLKKERTEIDKAPD